MGNDSDRECSCGIRSWPSRHNHCAIEPLSELMGMPALLLQCLCTLAG